MSLRSTLTWLLLVVGVGIQAQPNTSCATATPYIDNYCMILSPASAGPITRCYTFVCPLDSVHFQFVSFVPQGTCTDALSWYDLYDASCSLIATDSMGGFGGLTAGSSYTVCYNIQCPTNGVVNLICTSETATLPVELLYFTARGSVSGIELLWATGSERDCMGFMVERSTDLSDWLNIGFLSGNGNSTTVKNYTMLDSKPFTGVNYYRLRQVDLDGNYEIFQVIAIMWSVDQISSPFRLYNMLGQTVR